MIIFLTMVINMTIIRIVILFAFYQNNKLVNKERKK